ncbi:hypothetical protein [Desulfonema magnum]|uniref:Uncharacterized protein n=1 Tax=Desulfonema magnum TaxID=45655 RepID=A0A975BNF4_9BACT|nr:hypothetical protein [Desulfonema magnum]QTA88762.1 Uncharacterized protein dnm_048090 [Desulfonema magnum]
MKTGIIIYVLGNDPSDDAFDEKKAVKELEVGADKVEVVFSGEKHFDIMDAWFKLTTKGMHRIVCMFGEIAEHSAIKLTGREFQLCGY